MSNVLNLNFKRLELERLQPFFIFILIVVLVLVIEY